MIQTGAATAGRSARPDSLAQPASAHHRPSAQSFMAGSASHLHPNPTGPSEGPQPLCCLEASPHRSLGLGALPLIALTPFWGSCRLPGPSTAPRWSAWLLQDTTIPCRREPPTSALPPALYASRRALQGTDPTQVPCADRVEFNQVEKGEGAPQAGPQICKDQAA